MTSQCCCSKGWGNFGDFVVPEGMIPRKLGSFYKDSPILSRAIFTPIALVTGTVKPLLFPVICAIGIVVMPVMALVKACQGKRSEACDWLKAWAFCMLGAAAFVGLMIGVAALPLVISGPLLGGVIALSIIIHIYKVNKEPDNDKN